MQKTRINRFELNWIGFGIANPSYTLYVPTSYKLHFVNSQKEGKTTKDMKYKTERRWTNIHENDPHAENGQNNKMLIAISTPITKYPQQLIYYQIQMATQLFAFFGCFFLFLILSPLRLQKSQKIEICLFVCVCVCEKEIGNSVSF